jgi:hypothetical protein
MSMYKTFKTDDTLETQGVIIDYGQFRVTVARAGGANKRYGKTLEQKLRPFRRALQTDTMDEAKAEALLKETYAEAVVLNWEVQVDGEWVTGIEQADGSVGAFNRENVLKVFADLPDLFIDLRSQCDKVSLFRREEQEADAGN